MVSAYMQLSLQIQTLESLRGITNDSNCNVHALKQIIGFKI